MANNLVALNCDERSKNAVITRQILDQPRLLVTLEGKAVQFENRWPMSRPLRNDPHSGIGAARAPLCQALRQRYSMTSEAPASAVISAWS